MNPVPEIRVEQRDGRQIFYIDVGEMLPKEAENLIQRMKEKINERDERHTSFLR